MLNWIFGTILYSVFGTILYSVFGTKCESPTKPLYEWGNANATFTKVKTPITRDLFDQSPKFKRQNIRRQKLPYLLWPNFSSITSVKLILLGQTWFWPILHHHNVLVVVSHFFSICVGWILAFDGLLKSSLTWQVRNEGFFLNFRELR